MKREIGLDPGSFPLNWQQILLHLIPSSSFQPALTSYERTRACTYLTGATPPSLHIYTSIPPVRYRCSSPTVDRHWESSRTTTVDPVFRAINSLPDSLLPELASSSLPLKWGFHLTGRRCWLTVRVLHLHRPFPVQRETCSQPHINTNVTFSLWVFQPSLSFLT